MNVPVKLVENEISLANIEVWLLPVTTFLSCRTPQSWVDEAIKPQNLSLVLIDHLVCELKAAQTAALLLRKYVLDDAGSNALLKQLKPFEDYVYRQKGTLEELRQSHHFSKAKLSIRKDLNQTMFSSSFDYQSEPPDFELLAETLLSDMVLLIKEELHHFIQVLEIMQSRGVVYANITAGRYAKRLLQGVRTHEPMTLVDKLICGAYIEARSCERFARLAPFVDKELSQFYISLLRSEARHYQDYLSLSAMLMGETTKNSENQLSTQKIQDRIHFFARIEEELILSADSEFRFHSGVPM
ncbi:tRNA isopentenyl-2-thiomethyl-A-37 hydroxylase MiaE [Thorsellia kenyensis]|uniref:tRNA isopentenyl-2-thiomethyl-A-37 hydroxylase MiaE n=1 Tax=Thorsellia kenyensis TaxID=1549888 RepID=A0ABV6CC03_9GAMM